MPCKKEFCICFSRKEKLKCPFFTPSESSRYWRCLLWLEDRQPCPFTNKECKDCEHHIEPEQKRTLKGKESRQAINRRYYKRNKDKINRRRKQLKYERELES